MVFTATELTAEISPIRVSWMRQKANATMAAVDRTAFQIGTIAQDGAERQLILTNKRVDAVVLMPIRAKREEFRDRYRKNAKFSVRMLILFCTSSSYSLDANASRCRARFFCAFTRKRNQYPGAIARRGTNYQLRSLGSRRPTPQSCGIRPSWPPEKYDADVNLC
jgi:hypothetical protein